MNSDGPNGPILITGPDSKSLRLSVQVRRGRGSVKCRPAYVSQAGQGIERFKCVHMA